jgi:hypothetical protein
MDESLRPFFIFVEGADTLPETVPVFLVYGKTDALRICEAVKETEYGVFNFSSVPCTAENVNKIAAWAEMASSAQKGAYGEIIAGVCEMIGRIYERAEKLFSKPEENNANEAEKPPPDETEQAEVAATGTPAGPETEGQGKGGAGSAPTQVQSTGPDDKTPKRGRKVDKATIRRADFAKPLREKGESWPNIFAAYEKKYVRDTDTTEDILRRAFERQYPELSIELRKRNATE